MKLFLIFSMFLVIYSPKLPGNIDTLSAFSILIFGVALINNKFKKLYKRMRKSINLYIGFGFVMLVYSFILYVFNGLTGTYQILRFGRVIVNTLGVLGVAALYLSKYKESFHKYFLLHLWLCIILHGVIMLFMFVNSSFNSFVVNVLLQSDPMGDGYVSKIKGLRIGGLTSSWDATSGVQSLGILLLPYVYNFFGNSMIKKAFIILTIPLSLFCMAVSGVTGFVVIGAVGLIFMVYFHKKVKLKYLVLISFISLLLVSSLGYFMNTNNDRIKDSSIGRTIFMITQDDSAYSSSKVGPTAESTFDIIFNTMYFIPDEVSVILFGKGGSGRSQDYVIKADPGPTLNLFNLGAIFVLVFYVFCFRMFKKSIDYSKTNFYIGLSVASILLSLIIIDAKVQYLLARQSLSIMLIALIVLRFPKIKYR